jgi:hypothetical protein
MGVARRLLTTALTLAVLVVVSACANGSGERANRSTMVKTGSSAVNISTVPLATATRAEPLVSTVPPSSLIMPSSGGAASAARSSASPVARSATPSSPDDSEDGETPIRVAVVVSTNGLGVWSRAEPNGEGLRVWPEGAPMVVIGPVEEANGRDWLQVLTPDGVESWVAAAYLKQVDGPRYSVATRQ